MKTERIKDSILIAKKRLQTKKKYNKHPLYHQKPLPPPNKHIPITSNVPDKKLKIMNCSPVMKNKRANNNTCYNTDVLLKIRNEYNNNHPNNQHIVGDDPTHVWNELKNRLNCSSEDCWLKELKDENLRNKIDKYVFSPDSPPEWKSNPNEWLSNFDILDVLSQYEDAYPHFHFIGPTPIDFDTRLPKRNNMCVEKELCSIHLQNEIREKKTKIGIIFNLDEHDEKGSHWVSMFIDLEEKFIFYFDSAGDLIPPEIRILKDRLIRQAKKLTPPLKLLYKHNHNVEHQLENTECGVYSLFFIITMLTGDCKCGDLDKHNNIKDRNNMSFKDKMALFQKGRIPDNYIERYRKIYFNGA